MTITAAGMRKKAEEFIEAQLMTDNKVANDYVNRIVEPHIERCAKKGLTETTVEVPFTAEVDIVEDILKVQGFTVTKAVYTLNVKW